VNPLSPEEAQRARALIRALASTGDGPNLSSRVAAVLGLDESQKHSIPRLKGYVQVDVAEMRQRIDALGGQSSAARLLHVPTAHMQRAYHKGRTTSYILKIMDELIAAGTPPTPARPHTPKSKLSLGGNGVLCKP